MSDIPIGAYTFSDSYLRKLKKDDLIEHYRTLEKNWFNEIKSNNIQIDNSKKLLKEEYNKAVDYTIKSIKEEYAFTILEEEKIDEIAEQLKGAKQNEDFKQEEIQQTH